MSHESDVLEFVLFGGPFSLLRMAQVAFEIRQMRMWAHWNHRGFFALSSSSVSSFVVPLPALFFLSFNTWETRGICLACWGICDWRAFWAPKFPLLTSAPPAGFKQTRSHFPSLALHPPHHSTSPQQPLWQDSYSFSPIWTPQAARSWMQTVHPKTAFLFMRVC